MNGMDALQFRIERSVALLVDHLFVHAGLIERADFLIDGRPGSATARIGVEDFPKNGLVSLGQFIEPSPLRAIGGDWIVFHPDAASVFIEIVAGIGGAIDVLDGEIGRVGSRLGIGGAKAEKQRAERRTHLELIVGDWRFPFRLMGNNIAFIQQQGIGGLIALMAGKSLSYLKSTSCKKMLSLSP